MKTDVMIVSNSGARMQEALDQVGKVAAYKGLSPKSELHLRLLAEEMMGMMRSIAGEADGEFWIEDSDDVYELHLKVRTLIDEEQRRKLIEASTEGKNEAARGLMGRLRSFFDLSGGAPVMHELFMPGGTIAPEHMTWSMVDYRGLLAQYAKKDPGALEAWDELEKSVVAHVADDVKVAIRGRTVEMAIYKKLNG